MSLAAARWRSARRRLAGLTLLLASAGAAMGATMDMRALWDFERPELSETRFREALQTARGDDALVLRTQIARTFSLRKRFAEAHAELDAIEPSLAGAGAEPRVRALLERGRTLRSAGDPVAARPLFEQALALGESAALEDLSIDAMHMIALVEPRPEAQIDWNRRVIAAARAARDPAARGWEGPALNNLGVTLNEQGRHAEALAAFREALPLAQQLRNPSEHRIAQWMVAHTLRRMGRLDEAVTMQLELERQCDAAGEPDPYVYEELALLYEAGQDAGKAALYRQKLKAAGGTP